MSDGRDGRDHLREVGRLRAAEVVRAHAVGHVAVEPRHVEQIVSERTRRLAHPDRQQPEDHPVAVPVVALAKSPARVSMRIEGTSGVSEGAAASLVEIAASGMTASIAGASRSVSTRVRRIPSGATIPKTAIGMRPAVAKEAMPPAVVRLVMMIGRPEWLSAPTIASSREAPWLRR